MSLPLKRLRILRKLYLSSSDDYLNCVFSFILGKDVERMATLAGKWGPVPRALLFILEVPQYEACCEREAAKAIIQAVQNPASLFAAIADHDTSTPYSDSSSVFFIRPESKADRYLHSAYVPTSWLMNQLVDGLVCRRVDMRAEFFDAISDYFRIGFISDSLFTEIIRCFLARGENFTIRWYDQDIATCGHVLTAALDSFGFRALVSHELYHTCLLIHVFICRIQLLGLMRVAHAATLTSQRKITVATMMAIKTCTHQSDVAYTRTHEVQGCSYIRIRCPLSP